MEHGPRVLSKHPTHTHGANGRTSKKDGGDDANGSTAVVAHTLTACTRCRQVCFLAA